MQYKPRSPECALHLDSKWAIYLFIISTDDFRLERTEKSIPEDGFVGRWLRLRD